MQNLHANGSQSHINCTRVVASLMQIVPVWPPVTWNMNKINGNLHATGGQVDTICISLAASQVQFACDWWTRLQDKRQADKRCVKGRLCIIIIFFYHLQVHLFRHMLTTIQLTALGYLIWKMCLYYGWHSYSHTEANFARASGQLRAKKPPVFCKHSARTIIWSKKYEDPSKKFENYATHLLANARRH